MFLQRKTSIRSEPEQIVAQQYKTAPASNSISTGSFQSGPTQTNVTIRSPAQPAAAPARIPPGIPSNITQVEGLSISQALVNDVIVDLQTKVINESHQQFLSESSASQYLEPLPPIHIRAPNPTIILRSDLNRLRAEFERTVRAREQQRAARRMNQFSQPRFPAPGFQGPRFY